MGMTILKMESINIQNFIFQGLRFKQEMLKERYRSDHPDVAKQLNNLALLCQNQGKYEEVER